MTRSRFFTELASERAASLQTDGDLRGIARQFHRGHLAQPDAIVAMRQAGACEPEIVEALS